MITFLCRQCLTAMNISIPDGALDGYEGAALSLLMDVHSGHNTPIAIAGPESPLVTGN